MYERFTDGARKVLQLANQEAQRLKHEYVGTEHILLGLIKESRGFASSVLKNLDVDLRKIRNELEAICQAGPDLVTMGKLPQTPRAKKVIEYAIEEARNLKHNYVATEHLLLGLLREQEGSAAQVLTNSNLTLDKVREEVLTLSGHGMGAGGEGESAAAKGSRSKTSVLDSFGRDLTDLARQGKLDLVIGRQIEIERVVQILSRRTKKNVILVGEAGVGKTAIVDGVAQRILSGDVPGLLRICRIIALNPATMAERTRVRSQFEKCLRAAMIEARRAGNMIVFLNSLQAVTLTAGYEFDVLQSLRPALTQGWVRCIVATTPDEYHKCIEKDSMLKCWFQTLIVEPPSKSVTLDILRGLRDRYEAHHRVSITDEALEAAVEFSDRYIAGQCLPVKAIDVVDEAGARLRLKGGISLAPALMEFDDQINRLLLDKEEAVANQDFERAAALRDKADKIKKKKETLEREWRERADEVDGNVDEEVIAAVISKMTGISIMLPEVENATRLRTMEVEIRRRVVGQPEATRQVSEALRCYYSGLADADRPIGCFLFVGPTGVGKTYLARVLAEVGFGDSNALIELNMAQYANESAAERLTAVGSQLVEGIRRRPYAVVLLEAVDKANGRALDALLPVMEAGRLTDSSGLRVDFRSALLIMTTTAGSEVQVSTNAFGFPGQADINAEYRAKKERLSIVLERSFSPEFLSRLDDIIMFRRQDREDYKQLIPLIVSKFQARCLANRGLALEVTTEAADHLVDKGYNPDYGARPVLRAFAELVERPILGALLLGELRSAKKIVVRREIEPDGEGRLVFEAVTH